MLTIMLLAIGLPVLAGTAYLTLRDSRPKSLADMRGIALQTVIVIVVLLAIAGAVAGVLITRGEQAVDNLASQVGTHLTGDRFDTQQECDNAGFTWDADGPDDNASTTADNGCYTN